MGKSMVFFERLKTKTMDFPMEKKRRFSMEVPMVFYVDGAISQRWKKDHKDHIWEFLLCAWCKNT